jgi:hypothetical protein
VGSAVGGVIGSAVGSVVMVVGEVAAWVGAGSVEGGRMIVVSRRQPTINMARNASINSRFRILAMAVLSFVVFFHNITTVVHCHLKPEQKYPDVHVGHRGDSVLAYS